MTDIVHACPPDGSWVTPCCGESPFDLSHSDRITEDPALVTCDGERAAWNRRYADGNHSGAIGSQSC